MHGSVRASIVSWFSYESCLSGGAYSQTQGLVNAKQALGGAASPAVHVSLSDPGRGSCAGTKKKKNLAWLPSLSNPKSIIPPTSLGRQVLRLKQEPEASYPTAEIRSRTLYFEAKWNLFGRDPFCQLAMICEGMNRPLFSIFFFCPELQTGICRAVVNFKCVSFGTQ